MVKKKSGIKKKRGRKPFKSNYRAWHVRSDHLTDNKKGLSKAGVWGIVKKNRKKINWCKSFYNRNNIIDTGNRLKSFSFSKKFSGNLKKKRNRLNRKFVTWKRYDS